MLLECSSAQNVVNQELLTAQQYPNSDQQKTAIITQLAMQKKDKQKVSQSTQDSPAERLGWSVTDALTVLTHLTSRGVLCGNCGLAWAAWTNAAHAACNNCCKPNMVYNPQTKGSDFEKLLCAKLIQWASTNLS